jgi:hypothetical protein
MQHPLFDGIRALYGELAPAADTCAAPAAAPPFVPF